MNRYPMSWDEQGVCGCIMHVTDVGTGFISHTDYCDYHKSEIQKIRSEK